MTEIIRKKAAKKFRTLLNRGILRKQAIKSIKDEFGISRASLYNYCRQFRIKTN